MSSEDISEIYDEKTHKWQLTDKIIKDVLSNDIQSVLDCTSEADVLVFDTQDVIKLDNSISIKTNDLTLTGYKDIEVEKGIFYDSNIKAIFTCPDEKEAIFKIE